MPRQSDGPIGPRHCRGRHGCGSHCSCVPRAAPPPCRDNPMVRSDLAIVAGGTGVGAIAPASLALRPHRAATIRWSDRTSPLSRRHGCGSHCSCVTRAAPPPCRDNPMVRSDLAIVAGGTGEGAIAALHSRWRESIHTVTGPSLMRATCISAPKIPRLMGLPSSASMAAQNAS